jgi:hypothetical protein
LFDQFVRLSVRPVVRRVNVEPSNSSTPNRAQWGRHFRTSTIYKFDLMYICSTICYFGNLLSTFYHSTTLHSATYL